MAKPVIKVTGVVFRNAAGEVLTVRKGGTEGFMLPGGKPETGESAVAAGVREVAEELGVTVGEEDLFELGVFEAVALNEPGMLVRGHIFECRPAGGTDNVLAAAAPAAEIAEFRWVHPVSGDMSRQAPLNLEYVFPALRGKGKRKSLAVFLGSSDGNLPQLGETARQLGAECARRGIRLVYGGAQVGLMGQLAAGALDGGGEVLGIMPEFMLASAEKAHRGLSSFETVPTMHERKARMLAEADAVVALPGGPGTLEEFFEAWTWRYLAQHSKLVLLFNADGFYAPLLQMLDSMAAAGFVNPAYFEHLTVVETLPQLFDALGW